MAVVINGTTGITTPTETVVGLATAGSLQVGGVATNLQPLVSGTAVASTSGTSIDFTSIPSWVKRITVVLNGVSQSSIAPYGILRIGTGGSIVAIGYSSTLVTVNGPGTVATVNMPTGFAVTNFGAVADTVNGTIVLTLLGSNTWVASGAITTTNTLRGITTAGSIALGGALDIIRLTTTDGTTTFDAGSINILYE
jgi:hypothetical protein